MGTTTININGIPAAGSGGNTGAGNVGGQTGAPAQNAPINAPTGNDNNGGYSLPSNERMIEDIRREMRQRGVMLVPGSQSMHKIIDEYAQNQRKLANQNIGEKYDNLSQSFFETSGEKLEQRKKQRLADAYMNYRNMRLLADPNDKTIDADWEYSSIYAQAVKANIEDEKRVIRDLDSNDDELYRKEQEERTEVDKELTEAIKTLTSYFEREAESGSNSSYLGRLKEERKKLILERDSATTEAGAISAQTKLNDVNDRIQRVLNPKGGKEEEANINNLIMAQGLQGALSSIDNGDLFGAVGSLSNFGLSAAGLSKAAMRKAMGWIGVALTAGKGLTNTFEKLDSVDASYAILGGVTGNLSKAEFFDSLDNARWNNYDLYGLGMDKIQFAELMTNYAKSTGMQGYDPAVNTLLLAGAEKSWGLQRGALSKLTKFTRSTVRDYGTFGDYSVNARMGDAADALGMLYGSYDGFKSGDHSNSQRVLDTYASILESYGARSNKVNNFQTAASLMLTLSSNQMNEATGGKTLFDERTAGEIATLQNMIQSPANDRMQALIFGEVGKMIGSTDLSKIDQYIIDPKNELNIMQQVVKKISDLYGGVDTEMGYWAFKQLLPNMAPDRRKEYIEKLTSGKYMSGDMQYGKSQELLATSYSDVYVSPVTEIRNEIKSWLPEVLNKLQLIVNALE